MCDKGLLETDNSYAKIAYMLTMSKEIQVALVEGINELLKPLNETCFLANPLPGVYPEKNPRGENFILVESNENTYMIGKNVHHHSVVRFELTEMPGCCGILISHNMRVMEKYQGLGIAKFLQEIKEMIAKENNYTLLMSTVLEKNAIERHILETHGWSQINSFENKRTLNTVLTYVKEVK